MLGSLCDCFVGLFGCGDDELVFKFVDGFFFWGSLFNDLFDCEFLMVVFGCVDWFFVFMVLVLFECFVIECVVGDLGGFLISFVLSGFCIFLNELRFGM